MILYNILTISGIIFMIIFMIIFLLWITGIDIGNINMHYAMFITGFIGIVLICAVFVVENANTKVEIKVVEMQITKCDLTEDSCYITVNNEYMIRISRQEYARLNVGDVVLVEITKSTFNEKTKLKVELVKLKE